MVDLALLEQCLDDLDHAEGKKNELHRSILFLEKAIDDDKTAIETLAGEIAALVAGIMVLDYEADERAVVRCESSDCVIVMAGASRLRPKSDEQVLLQFYRAPAWCDHSKRSVAVWFSTVSHRRA